ncbi:MAG: hypothetical protein GXY58_12995 [Planctomycetaceae bacterium]|nr:hypothetical protein [Planctomycetaceae bacterium]
MENISFNTRKSLCNHLGDTAGNELADFLLKLKRHLERIERTKVDRTPIVPDSTSPSLIIHSGLSQSGWDE